MLCTCLLPCCAPAHCTPAEEVAAGNTEGLGGQEKACFEIEILGCCGDLRLSHNASKLSRRPARPSPTHSHPLVLLKASKQKKMTRDQHWMDSESHKHDDLMSHT